MEQQKVDQNLDSESSTVTVDLSAQLDESKAAATKLRSRISFLRSRLKLNINPSIAHSAIEDYSNLLQKNPKLSHFRILSKMQQQKRDALSQVNSAVPLPILVNASDSQFRRTVRDIMREQKEMLNEEFNPPAVLLLKRQAIRQFPSGQRIALYIDNKYGLQFTVPYDAQSGLSGRVVPGMVAEETELQSNTVNLTFATGEELQVEQSTIDKINEVYDQLNEENKQRILDMILESVDQFDRVVTFVNSVGTNE